jgi:cell wall-associated NlpC family hydrolase
MADRRMTACSGSLQLPDWHIGFGPSVGVDCVGHHRTAVALAQRIRLPRRRLWGKGA